MGRAVDWNVCYLTLAVSVFALEHSKLADTYACEQ